jgi:1,4-dihydroxy-2-naphthoate octaprenyltransferase
MNAAAQPAAVQHPPRPSAAVALLYATRPKTLVAGLVPVLVGSALALRSGQFSLLRAAVTLAGALLIQIGTNLGNDYHDFIKGADTGDRLGPARATQQGWLAPRVVLGAALSSFALAAAVGMVLVAWAGVPILVVGLVSIAAGYAYTGGPFPLGYHGLGDVFVLAFFGLVAVGGTFFVQTGAVSSSALLCGLAVGAGGVALLAVNNTRDADTDRAAGKRTLVVRFGRGFGRAEYVAMVALTALVPLVLFATGLATAWVLISLAALPLAFSPVRTLFTQSGAALNKALAATARFQLVYGFLFSLGLCS